MFIRLNTRRLGRLRTSAGLAGGIAVLLQLFAAGGLACSTMDMGEDAAAHAMMDALSRVGHVHGTEASSTAVESEAPATESGACAMMMHCTAPAVTLPTASLDVRVDVPIDDHDRQTVPLASAPLRTSVPPPRA